MQAPEERTVAAFTSPRAHHTTGTTWPLRQRLLDRLFEESSDTSSRRLIAVCAPMGYGKSRTVAAWIGDGRLGHLGFGGRLRLFPRCLRRRYGYE